MYIRTVPPAGLNLEGLVQWLLIEFQSLEMALEEQEVEIQKLKEFQNAV